MGYTTDFEGRAEIAPPLNPHEIAYLRDFANTRHCPRKSGPYVIDEISRYDDPDIIDINGVQDGMPGYWCNWEPTDDGTALEWNGTEKFYDSDEWMAYVISTFLQSGAALKRELENPVPGRYYPEAFQHFTFDHVLNGRIRAQGEDPDDQWTLLVTADGVRTYDGFDEG